MHTPIKTEWDKDKKRLVIVWDAYIALLALEAQVVAVRTAIAEKRFTWDMYEAFGRNFDEEEITELFVLLHHEIRPEVPDAN